MNQELKMVTLEEIIITKDNPRTGIKKDAEFEEMVLSVATKGILQSILLRKSENGGPMDLAAGERRVLAAIEAGKRNLINPESFKIPAVIRTMTDGEFLDAMWIENHHRKDLTPYDEAVGFKKHLAKRKETGQNEDEVIINMAAGVGVAPWYIRRQIRMVSLPKNIVKWWKEDRLGFAHMLELLKLYDDKEMLQKAETLLQQWYDRMDKDDTGYIMSVSDLRRYIERSGILLSKSRFDQEKEGCIGCYQNSDIQKAMFHIGDEGKPVCSNVICFMEKQRAHITANFTGMKVVREFKVNDFRFRSELEWNDFHELFNKNNKIPKCLECKDFICILNMDGSVDHKMACIGTEKCADQMNKFVHESDKKKGKKGTEQQSIGAGENETKRGHWHGEHFREDYIKSVLPERLAATVFGQDKSIVKELQLQLYSMVIGNKEVQWDFYKTYMLSDKDKAEMMKDQGVDNVNDIKPEWFRIGEHALLYVIFTKMKNTTKLTEAIRFVTASAVSGGTITTTTRYAIAQHIGIDIAKEWSPTEDYLSKKTMPELFAFATKWDLFKHPDFKVKVKELGGESAVPEKLKKKVLIAGLVAIPEKDLKGKVPEEIVKIMSQNGSMKDFSLEDFKPTDDDD